MNSNKTEYAALLGLEMDLGFLCYKDTAPTALRSASCLNSQRGDGMDGENYQAMFVCGRAAAWDKPRSERAAGRGAGLREKG